MAQQVRTLVTLVREPGFGCLHPHDDSALAVTPVPGDPTPSSDRH